MIWHVFPRTVLLLVFWIILCIIVNTGPLDTKDYFLVQMKTMYSHHGGTSFRNITNNLRAKRSQTAQRSLVKTKQSKTEPVILLLSEWGRSKKWGEEWTEIANTTTMYLNTCPHKCHYTLDRQMYEETADLVIMPTFYWSHYKHLRSLNVETIIKGQERTGQLWLGLTKESPLLHSKYAKGVDGVFHWIGNYRKDADIPWPYGFVKKLSTSKKAVNQTTAGRKKKRKQLVAWLVSRCRRPSKREQLVKSLMHHIPVDIYGNCTNRKCPHKCWKYLGRNYKFYLAFENSLCLDYVTEKLYHALREDIVPIVYAWINDTTLAPPHSYINALDFKSAKDLADYLKYLDSHDEEYEKYFEWKRKYKVKRGTGMCRACGKLLEHLKGRENNTKTLPPSRKRMMQWLNTLPGSKTGAERAEFTFGGKTLKTKNVCVDPQMNKDLMDWIKQR